MSAARAAAHWIRPGTTLQQSATSWMHAAKGEPEPARARFTAALAILDRLGERLYAEHVERALAELQRG